ncbi:MAG: nucleoside hydrolase [Acidobacteriaceae bacterium]|nr:nucleoside hydrolase [Acidobacteriaceae bacterium]
MSRKFLIDTDTASDDAVALIMALQSPEVDVLAITTVAGNVGVDQATRNALYTVELCGARVPVYRGAEKPLARPLEDATWFHGMDGLGDRGYPEPKQRPAPGNAVEALTDLIVQNPGVELVTLGPLTNIARLLQRAPALAGNIGRCVLMGGAPCSVGNVTPAAEYNIWTDPEAAQIVLRSDLEVELIGWHLCRFDAVLNETDIARIQAFGTDRARFAVDCNCHARLAYREQTGEDGISLPDPVAMAIALDRTIGSSWSKHYVDVETQSVLTRGMTVVDRLNIAGNPRNREIWKYFEGRPRRTNVCWSLDIPRWKQRLMQALV